MKKIKFERGNTQFCKIMLVIIKCKNTIATYNKQLFKHGTQSTIKMWVMNGLID
jgi:hypothetical protein